MRERGVQSRRVRPGNVEPARRPGPPPRGGGNFWQVLAIVALVAATAGWTTVVVLALRGAPTTAAVSTADDSFDPNASDDAGDSPEPDSHDAPELEALLPNALQGTPLNILSLDGSGVFTPGDAWSTAMTLFLTNGGKAPTDLHFAQAYDPNQTYDGSVGVYSVAGVEGAALRDAIVKAWNSDYPDLKVSQLLLDGKEVTRADFGTDTITSYYYVRDGVVYDIETTDEKIATAALAALPAPGASGPPSPVAPSGSPAASPAPS